MVEIYCKEMVNEKSSKIEYQCVVLSSGQIIIGEITNDIMGKEIYIKYPIEITQSEDFLRFPFNSTKRRITILQNLILVSEYKPKRKYKELYIEAVKKHYGIDL